jgi:hypothetical protein
MNITLSEQKITDAAHRIKTLFANKDITRKGKPIGANFCQQIITQGLLDKPFEEVLALLAKDTPVVNNNTLDANVFVFKYGSDAILAYVNNSTDEPTLDYYVSRAVGTDMELSENEIYRQAESLAHIKGTRVETVYLPEILTDEWEYDEVMQLATAMQYHMRSTTLLDVFSQDDIKVFIDDNHTVYLPSDEWTREIITVSENLHEDGDFTLEAALKEVTAWMPEYVDEDYGLHEFYFSVHDLVNATPVDGKKNVWVIHYDLGNVGIVDIVISVFNC